jgi:hypothetical protein
MDATSITFSSILNSAAKIPLVRIDREAFLQKNLIRYCPKEQVQTAISSGTRNARIPIPILDSIANAVINLETTKVTAFSTAAGMPGGWTMAATIPADLVQTNVFVIRVAQELAYLYGWKDFFSITKTTESGDEYNLDAKTENELMIFIGVMFGVSAAKKVLAKIFGVRTMQAIAKKIASQALTKTWYYPIAKKIGQYLGVKVVKSTFGQGVSKVVPVIGGLVPGGLTLTTFKTMASRLQKHLSNLARMSPEEYDEYQASITIKEEDIKLDEPIDVEAVPVDTSYWICACETKNKGRFCINCGKEKPAGLPQYKCDKCGWEPPDKTQPPKFCIQCGDLFDENDIVLG